MRPTCPARQYGRLGTYWTTMIGKKRVTLFKSDSHMSQDGPKLPNRTVWEQIIADCKPGSSSPPAPVAGSAAVAGRRRDRQPLRRLRLPTPVRDASTDRPSSATTSPSHNRFDTAESLFASNSQFLPPDNRRPPRIIVSGTPQTGIVTTDFFGFDNSSNTYQLQGKGDLSEMGDAVLGLACRDLGSSAPTWVIVRNVSDPQIDSTGLTLTQQKTLAADIYKAYGRWSSVCSADRLLGDRSRSLNGKENVVQYKLGREAPVYDSRTLQFADYVQPHLPPPPESVDWGKRSRSGRCTRTTSTATAPAPPPAT